MATAAEPAAEPAAESINFDHIFAKFDVNKDGQLSPDEVHALVDTLFKQMDSAFAVSEDDHKTLFALFDRDNSGSVSVEEMKASWGEWFCAAKERRKALIIVDMQNDFISGSLAVTGAESIVARINDLRERVAFELVVHTQDWHPADHCSFHDNYEGAAPFSLKHIPTPDPDDPDTMEQVLWPRHCVQGDSGAAFHKDLLVRETDIIVQKGKRTDVDSYSGFYDNYKGAETELRALLLQHRISECYVVGVAFDFCVGSTAYDAKSCGFSSYLLTDLTKAVSVETEKAMVAKLKEVGVGLVDSGLLPLKMDRGAMPSAERALQVAKQMVQGRLVEDSPLRREMSSSMMAYAT